ncbi:MULTISPECIES: hypothetical protein [unclassified Rhodococcus (in: high G+C Gram-positive bacteria)]|uniref:hypothetical protein n=1 Tax=unclassified Rhodococcus (in: high G+C Gram-positive bacteria) TaxID=192944 RepID=UPI00111545BB|nr:hypothetical protein [Rhodococcus sp. M8]QPG47451.1 hypothetical protein ISO16_10925 [Rhodococcus sp. M8]
MRRRQLMERLVDAQRYLLIGGVMRQLCMVLGLDIPRSVTYGADFRIYHRGVGTVIHPNTVFGDRVRLYHGVTIGRADSYTGTPESDDLRFIVEDDVALCAGSVVLASSGVLRIGRGTVVAANAVLRESTGDYEVWAGVPARRVASRSD